MRKVGLLLIVMLFFANLVYGFSISKKAGTAGYTFLKLSRSARASAMGDAYVGLTDSPDGYLFNPAAIVFYRERAVLTSYANLYSGLGINNGLIGFLQKFGNIRTGTGISYLDYGTLKRTDADGNVLGDFSGLAVSLTVAFGDKIKKNISWGVAPNFIYEGIDSLSSWGLSVNTGLLAKFDHGRTSVGLAINNMGFQKSGFNIQHKDPLPLNIRLGMSRELKGLPLIVAAEISKSIDETFKLKGGGEVDALDPLLLRVGWQLRPTAEYIDNSKEKFNGLSGGFGLKLDKFVIDYSLSSCGVLGEVHRFSLAYTGF